MNSLHTTHDEVTIPGVFFTGMCSNRGLGDFRRMGFHESAAELYNGKARNESGEMPYGPSGFFRADDACFGAVTGAFPFDPRKSALICGKVLLFGQATGTEMKLRSIT
jgi:hypothetical protein